MTSERPPQGASASAVDAAVRDLCAAAPAGLDCVEEPLIDRLREVTSTLLDASGRSTVELSRFMQVRQRGLVIDASGGAGLRGKCVLITGGTGCIGSGLAEQLVAFEPRRTISISRGAHPERHPADGIERVCVDIRDRGAVGRAFVEVRPDVVFHVAAQREPGRAERDVHETISTNVVGTRNVLDASRLSGVSRFVYASTGKALRPYMPHVYGASKRMGEWLVLDAARRSGMPCSVVRFTHVVDNSLVAARFLGAGPGEVLRVHDPDVRFYAQSRLEAAQLLVLAALAPAARAEVSMFAIQDLGIPFRVLDIALGVLAAERRRDGAIYFSGYDPGYRDAVYPGLYDPVTAVDASPLFNAFEAHAARPTPFDNVESAPLRIAPDRSVDAALEQLEARCQQTANVAALRAALHRTSAALLRASVQEVPHDVLGRVAHLAAPFRHTFSSFDRLVDDEVRDRLAADERHREGAWSGNAPSAASAPQVA